MRKPDPSKIKRLIKVLKWMSHEIRPILPVVILLVCVGAGASVLSIYMTFVSKELIDAAVAAKAGFVQKYALFFGGIIIFQIILSAFLSLMTMKAGEKTANGLRARLFRHLTEADYMQVSAYHSGDILTRMTSDVSSVVGLFIGMVPSLIAQLVQLFGAFFALYIFNKQLAYLAFCIAPVTLLVTRLFAGKLSRLSKAIQEAESKYRSYMGESIQNLLVIKSYDMGKHVIERFRTLQYNRFDLVMERTKVNIGLSSTMSIGYFTGYFMAFYFGAMGLIDGSITFGTLAAFLQLVEKIQSPFMSLASMIPGFISTAVSAERLIIFEDLEKEGGNDEDLNWETAGIQLKDLSFSYDDGNITSEADNDTCEADSSASSSQLLNSVNLTIEPGSSIAVVGTSGEGKTTLIRLLLTLVKPKAGQVLFCGPHGIQQVANGSTRKLISYVPQGNTLFSGTIRENVLAGMAGVSDYQLERALEIAMASGFVRELKDGLDTFIGENGFGMSEGQAQRIAIARAILKDAPILIFDEATSALDAETEKHVISNITKYCGGKTCILITHREAALGICDHVYHLRDGELTVREDGDKSLAI